MNPPHYIAGIAIATGCYFLDDESFEMAPKDEAGMLWHITSNPSLETFQNREYFQVLSKPDGTNWFPYKHYDH